MHRHIEQGRYEYTDKKANPNYCFIVKIENKNMFTLRP